MAYTWTEDLATGNKLIDGQHKDLFKMVNDLMDACTNGRGQEHIDEMMQFLINYTVKHFEDEERLQQQNKYPDFENHKKLHEAFKATVGDLAKRLKTEGASVSLVTQITSSAGTWLRNHIRHEDKKLAAYINN
jgi:hemerythrin